jgi:hypothetical protein
VCGARPRSPPALTAGDALAPAATYRCWLAADRTDSAFHALKTPAAFTSFTVDGTTLYGITDTTTATYQPARGEGLGISTDAGHE